MNKETIYKKVQDLFPSELGVGDVVESNRSLCEWNITLLRGKWASLIDNDNHITEMFIVDLKLIRKRITLSMVLEAIRIKYIGFNNYNDFFSVYKGKADGKFWKKRDKCIMIERQLLMLWIAGKDLHLYDQSIDLIKLVWEILK